MYRQMGKSMLMAVVQVVVLQFEVPQVDVSGVAAVLVKKRSGSEWSAVVDSVQSE